MKEKDATHEDRESQESKAKRTIKTKYSADINYFSILEIEETATKGEIKKAYRRLTRKYHPDALAQANLSESELHAAEQKHHLISIARDILLDDDLRSEWLAKHQALLEKKRKLEAESIERRKMREALEAREAAAAQQTSQLNTFQQKMALAKHIRESGGYAELDAIQEAYEKEMRAQFDIDSHSQPSTTKDTTLFTLKVVWKKRHATAKKLKSHHLKSIMTTYFGKVDHVVKTSGKRLALIQFSSLKSVSKALSMTIASQKEDPIHDDYFFQFTSLQ